ncbi:General secretion pathway protein G [Pseudomonas chlororaphis subsp. aurantiaca]|nr:General secretion pathway protein G [Pseudomonas chlororaphis subsp. aurantiaca]
MDVVRFTSHPQPHLQPRRQPRRPRGQGGFTLIEIMVVVVILGILAAMVVPKVLDRPDQARATAAKQDIGGLMQALKLYRLDHGTYPSMNQGLKVLVARPADAKNSNWRSYLERLPNDPWGRPYHYLNPGPTAKWMCSPWGPTASQTVTA